MSQTKLRQEQLELVAKHYRNGVVPEYIGSLGIHVTAGDVVIDEILYSESENSDILDISDAADYIGGDSQRGTDKWLYVYVASSGSGWAPLLYDEPPLYPTCEETIIFDAQLDANPALAATALSYDNDTGEANVVEGDVICAWEDDTFSTWVCAWTVVSIDTGADNITVEANNCDAADDDYITIVHGLPRYRQVSGIWYRCVGAIRLDDTGSGEIITFFMKKNGLVMWDIGSDGNVVSLAHNTSYENGSAAEFVPPYSRRASFVIYSERANLYTDIHFACLPADTPNYNLPAGGYNYAFNAFYGEISPNQGFQYKVTVAAMSGYVYVNGYIEEL